MLKGVSIETLLHSISIAYIYKKEKKEKSISFNASRLSMFTMTLQRT